MNGQPTAQNTRETGADGDLPGLAQLGQPGARRASSRELWNVEPAHDPALGAADARHADLALRRAGLDRAAVDLGDQPGGLAARPRRACARILARARAVRGRAGPLPDRDGRSSPTWCCRPPPGARRPGRSPTPTARCTSPSRRSSRRARRAPTSTSSSTTRSRMDFRDRDGAPADQVERRRRRRSRPGRPARAGGPATTRGLTLRPAARRRRHPVAVHTEAPGRHRAPLHRRRVQHRPRLLRRPSGTTSSPARPSPRRSTAPSSPAGAPSCTRADYAALAGGARPRSYPLLLTTGRTVYHFHTRTKTGRAPELEAAAPDVWVEIMRARTPTRSGVAEGDLVADRVPARRDRGAACGSAASAPGMVFVPVPLRLLGPRADARPRRRRAAPPTSSTITAWDPVSKQPHLQGRRRRARQARAPGRLMARSPTTSACCTAPRARARGRRSAEVGRGARRRRSTSFHICPQPRRASATTTRRRLTPFVERYGEEADDEPDRLHAELFAGDPRGRRSGCCATSRTST